MSNNFESVLERLGRILAAQYHIEVIFEGNQACTDGKKIILPYIQDMSEFTKNDLVAFLDHEVGHCKFTTFPEIGKIKTRFHKELVNAIEDVRIEREMCLEYPGAKFNLDPLNEKCRARMSADWSKLPLPIRAIVGIRDYMEGNTPRIDDDIKFIERVAVEAKALNKCTSTEEVRIKTLEIVNRIVRDKELEEKKKDEKSEKSGKDKSKKSKSKSKSSSSEGAKSKDAGEEGAGDEASDGESSEEREDSSSEGSSEDGSEESSEVSEDSETAKEGGLDPMFTESVGKKDSEYDKHVTDVASLMAEEIKKEIEKSLSGKSTTRSTVAIPLTTRFDKVTDHSGKGDSSRYGKMRKSVSSVVAGVRTQLEQILKVKENARWKTECDRGTVDTRTIARLTTTGNRYAFKQFTKTETNNVAVQILVDMSGSMGDGKMSVAKEATTAMAEALNALNIPFEVTGFHSQPDSKVTELYRSMKPDDVKRFTRRHERLELHIFKSFTTVTLNGIEKLFVGQQNPDGECVSWAAKRLVDRKEKRKILLVLSDGQPCTGDSSSLVLSQDLKRRVAELGKSGIECVGIGICTEAVKEYYPDFIVLNNLKELPKAAMNKLSKLLSA